MQPLVSIVVPTRNRSNQLATCLEALGKLRYPADRFEVIVVDDGSRVPLEAIVAKFADRLEVRLLRRSQGGAARARNTGAAVARGEVLAFTDDDCAPAPEWLQTMIGALAQHPASLVGGRTVNALQNNVYAAASQTLIDYLYTYYNVNPARARFFTSNNIALRSELYRQVGGFPDDWPCLPAEDREFCDRLCHQGAPLVYCPEAVVLHQHDLTLGGFWRQHVNYGRGAWHFHRARTRRGKEPPRLEPLTFYLELLRYPSAEGGQRPRVLRALFVLSQVANAAGFYRERLTVASAP
jgi:glycosyltransferase involved in cell wall biosynthesis